MNFDFADMLLEVDRAGRLRPAPHRRRPPHDPRCAGGCTRSRTTRRSRPRTRARSSTRSSPTTSASAWRPTGRSTSRTRCRGRARFRVNAYFQRAAIGAAFRLIPVEIMPIEELGLPPVSTSSSRSRAASCSSPGRPAPASPPRWPSMIDEINEDAPRAHHDDRGPDRVPPPHKNCIVNQREMGADAESFARGPEGRAAPGPRRDPRRRDARPRDDLDRADRGRDRPPRVRHAAHPGHRRRRSTASSTCSRPTSSSRCACSSRSRSRGSSPSSCCRPPTAPAAASRPRC